MYVYLDFVNPIVNKITSHNRSAKSVQFVHKLTGQPTSIDQQVLSATDISKYILLYTLYIFIVPYMLVPNTVYS